MAKTYKIVGYDKPITIHWHGIIGGHAAIVGQTEDKTIGAVQMVDGSIRFCERVGNDLYARVKAKEAITEMMGA